MRSAKLVYEIPKSPKSEVFAYEHRVDPMEVRYRGNDPEFMNYLKRRMAHALADHIVDVCQLFEPPSMRDLERGMPIRMECTINDRGAYEHWIPKVRDEARNEGVKQGVERAIELMPYGIEPGQYYE